jgi:RND family efflux transporter MFP subunit
MHWFLIFILLFLSACQQPQSSIPRTAKKRPVHLVETVVVTAEPLTTAAVYTGTLRALRIVRIFAQESGRITHFPYYPSDRIKRGTVLVQLDDALLKAELDKAIAVYNQSRVNVHRLKKLAKRKLVSADELLRAETEQAIARAEEQILRTRLSYTQIKAPFAGIVTARLVEPGDVIDTQTALLTLIDPNSLVIDVAVSEWLLSHLKLKHPVSVRIDALGTQNFKGQISRLYPSIDPQTRLGHIEISLHPLPQKVREGQFCRVTIETHLSKRLAIPYSALRRDQAGEYVFQVDSTHQVQRLTVRSGRRLADKIEIISGIQSGQVIVKKGFLGLQAGKKVEAVN